MKDSSPDPSPPARRVLVVDDEVGLRMTLAANLELEGFTVREAGSGEEALALIQQERFDLVMTDIRMPGISGVELFRKLRERVPGIPVVLMTGFALEELVTGALEDGVFTVLAKPFDVAHALRVASSASGAPVVLVVDDAASVGEALQAALRECGLRTLAVGKLEAAVQAVQHQNVDVCVVDMLMPGTSGPEVIQHLRVHAPNLLVIAMSGQEVPELIRQMAALGMHTFMKKPFRIQELLRSIALARGSRRAEGGG